MQKLVCKSCGAAVAVVTPCTCDDCGISCCGKQMEAVEMTADDVAQKELSCAACGAKVRVIKDCTCGDCGISCCGTAMK